MYKNIEFFYLLVARKSAMANGVGAFTKAASVAYKNISEAERKELVDTDVIKRYQKSWISNFLESTKRGI